MLMDDDVETNDSENTGSSLPHLNPNAPDFAKDIRSRKSGIPLDMNFEFIPQNPYTLTTDAASLGQSQEIKGIQEKPSFFETAKAEAYKWNFTAQGLHAGYEQFEKVDPLDDVAPADWSPKSDPSKFVNVKPEYLKYLMDATGPKDLDYRLQRVYSEQDTDESLANGSWMAKLVGGAAGLVSDPMTYIPVVGWAKYAKLAPTFFKSAMRALPGVGLYSIASSGAEQADKINGNMTDFLTDSFVRTTMGTVLFGALGAGSLFTDKMALWGLRDFAKSTVEGIDFKLATDEAGKVTGFKAFDTTDSLSAAKVSFAQDLADSTFSKQGVFKIPYVGEALTRFLTLPGFGTPLPALLNSPFKTVRGFVDRVADHSIITKRVAEGEVAPRKFASLMNQEFSALRAMQAQVDALHLERNGFNSTIRPLNGLINLGLNLKDKTLKVFAEELDKTGYTSKNDFYAEIEEVLRSEVSSKHASVNEAASMMRKQMDKTYTAYREAYGLPKDWLPPKTAEGYLTRVYDTEYMNANEHGEGGWVPIISNWLRDADQVIANHMEPITSLENRLSEHERKHQALINRPNILDVQVKKSVEEGMALRARKNALEEKLQNELRANPDLILHVEDINALSANEAKEIQQLTKRRDIALKEINERKKIIDGIKQQISKRESAAKKGKTVKTAKSNLRKSATGALVLEQEEAKLALVEKEYNEEVENLQQMMHEGKINPRLYVKAPDSFVYHFKDVNNRLKFRKQYETHAHREAHAKAYYDTIMNQTPEDTINQVMGRLTGNARENPLKQRTLLIPDEVLYKNNFMSKDLMAKISNYTTFLARRTHLKSIFNDVTVDGGIEPLLHELNAENEAFRAPLNAKKAELQEKLKNPDISKAQKTKLEKQVRKIDKEFSKVDRNFKTAKKQMNHLYEKMMGIRKTDRNAQKIQSGIMSVTAMANLPFVPFTMINDLGAIGLQHGILPFIRDGVYPVIQSIAGLLKTKESEALRKTAPSVHLALQDVLNGYADRNWSMMNNPYLNLGRTVNTLEKIAHASTNFTGTNFLDNGLQHITASISQSEFMRILHSFKQGKMSARDGQYIRKYGLDPEKWSDRMISAFKKDGGGKTKLGGYQSHFWQWQDLEAANELGNAVYRAVKDTQIQSGIADSPFWTDSILGSIVKGFNGWMYASVNRYVVPSMQASDLQKFMGVLFMLGTGSLVSPMRRMARGESPYPDNMTDKQWMWQTIQDSGYFSYFSTFLADANILTGDRMMGDLKNDKYKDRTMTGLLGPGWGTANRIKDVISALGSGEWNEADAKKAARMIPFANASWTFWMSKKLIEGLELPKTRRQAHALKEINQ